MDGSTKEKRLSAKFSETVTSSQKILTGVDRQLV